MFLLLLIGYLIYRNAQLANAKDKNMFLWGLLTFIAIFITEGIGMVIIMLGYYPEFAAMQDPGKSQQVARSISEAISNNMLQSSFIMFCGVGGYLLIRYILERSAGGGTPLAEDDE